MKSNRRSRRLPLTYLFQDSLNLKISPIFLTFMVLISVLPLPELLQYWWAALSSILTKCYSIVHTAACEILGCALLVHLEVSQTAQHASPVLKMALGLPLMEVTDTIYRVWFTTHSYPWKDFPWTAKSFQSGPVYNARVTSTLAWTSLNSLQAYQLVRKYCNMSAESWHSQHAVEQILNTTKTPLFVRFKIWTGSYCSVKWNIKKKWLKWKLSF